MGQVTKWYLLALVAVNMALLPMSVSEVGADSGDKNCYFHGPLMEPPNACSCVEATPAECSSHAQCSEIYETLCANEEEN